MEVAVVGAGSWGTALTLVLARNGQDVRLYGREDENFASLCACRENLTYLPGHVLPDTVQYATLSSQPVSENMVIVAVPSPAVRDVLPSLAGGKTVCVASKGLDSASGGVLSDVIQKGVPDAKLAALSGPNLALELAQGIPTVAVVASPDVEVSESLRSLFMCRSYRVYVSEDMKGVELAGALKNVMAIAAGISDGLGYGDNTKGALLARGLNEMARIGVRMGASVGTFLGIAGVGDLFATAASKLSRNYRVGYGIGQGKPAREVISALGQVAEGVSTAETALRIARQLQIPAPITEVVDSVIKAKIAPRDAVTMLMERAPAREGEFGT